MAVTCYARLVYTDLGQLSPPYFTATADYTLINPLTGAVVNAESTGTATGEVSTNVNPPIATQAALLTALQVAIQAAEPASPGLVFVWLAT